MSVHTHKKKKIIANCIIVTISDTRTNETDKSGNIISNLLEQAGHNVQKKEIVRDQKEEILSVVKAYCETPSIDVIITNGGTGISKRDVTIETIQPLFAKEITGFGELFRMLSYQEDIGSAALLSRAIAGIYMETSIFSIPGSSGAVKLAMNKLILPELSHIVTEIKKDI